jgi:hypothetical protein
MKPQAKPNKMEKIIKWTSHKHPNNPNFMQVVKFMHIQTKDGKNTLYWALQGNSANDTHFIADISLEEAKAKFMDIEINEITFNEWIKDKNK